RGLMQLADFGRRAVLTAHDMASYKRPEWFRSGQSMSVRVIVPRSMRRAHSIIAVSASTARDVADLFDIEPARLEVVHEGVARRYRPLPVDLLQAARARFRLPPRIILFCSTVVPRQNLHTTLVDL